MPPPNLLTISNYGAGNVQVHELAAGTTPTQIGSDLPTAAKTTAPTTTVKTNMSQAVVTFKGERYALAYRSTTPMQVHRENEGGAGAWGTVHTTSPGTLTGGAQKTGLHIVKDGNDVALAFAHTNGNLLYILKSNDGTTWSQTTINLGADRRPDGVSIVYRNKIYYPSQGTLVTVEVDPQAATATVILSPSIGAQSYFVANDRLFGIFGNVPTQHWSLYEFTGGGWVLNSQITTTGMYFTNESQSVPLGFLDQATGNLVVIVNGDPGNAGANYGATCFEGTPSGSTFTWAENVTTVPTALQQGAGRPVAGVSDRWTLYVDNDTDPANPAYYILVMQGPAPGTGWAMYRYEGVGNVAGQGAVSSEIGPGASLSSSFSLPHTPHGGGETISQGLATFGEIEDEEAVPGGYRLSYRTPGLIAGLTGRVYVSLGQGAPDTLVTLVGGLQTFGPITGDARAVLRTIDVDLTLSGITGPDASNWMIDLR